MKLDNPLLRRAFLYLEDGEWGKADDYCEQVLDQEPENAMAYVIKSKKRGVKCIGCPDGHKCSGNCGSCGGCGGHM